MDLADTQFWTVLLQIVWIDVLLSGDNAVVIALACRSLPQRQKKFGIVLGAGAAIVLRVVFAIFIVHLLDLRFLKLAGALLLAWIAVKLMLPGDTTEDPHVSGSTTLFGAVRTIVVADVVMSLDNVIAIAAASQGRVYLLALGLLISVPLILFGSALILKAIGRFPALITAGAALLGYIAGDLMVSDPILVDWVETEASFLHVAAPGAGACGVVAIGALAARMNARRRPPPTPGAPATRHRGESSKSSFRGPSIGRGSGKASSRFS